VQVSGLSSEDTRLGHLEQNMKEVRNDVQSALQQLDSRQQIADKQFLDLYHLHCYTLSINREALPTNQLPTSPLPQATAAGTQSSAPATKDNLPTSLDLAGSAEAGAGYGS